MWLRSVRGAPPRPPKLPTTRPCVVGCCRIQLSKLLVFWQVLYRGGLMDGCFVSAARKAERAKLTSYLCPSSFPLMNQAAAPGAAAAVAAATAVAVAGARAGRRPRTATGPRPCAGCYPLAGTTTRRTIAHPVTHFLISGQTGKPTGSVLLHLILFLLKRVGAFNAAVGRRSVRCRRHSLVVMVVCVSAWQHNSVMCVTVCVCVCGRAMSPRPRRRGRQE